MPKATVAKTKKKAVKKRAIKISKPEFKVTKKLFRPKFVHLAHHIHDNLLRAPFLIGGFYNWHRVLSGEFKLHAQTKGTLKNYDIIFMGLSRPEMEGLLISEIREELGNNSNTKIVVCVDYAIEIWHNTFNMKALQRELQIPNIVFTGEPKMKNQLEVLTGRKVHLLEHPTNTRVIKQLALPIDQRKNAILCLIHRYNNDWIPPYLVVKDFHDIDNYAILLDGSQSNIIQRMPFFQYVRPGTEYDQWLDFARQGKILLDSYHNIHTYGRNSVDCACLRVPVIGTNLVHAQNILWPQLTTEPNDLIHQRDLVARLKSDQDFYKEVTDYAYDNVDQFGYQSSLEKFQKMVESYDVPS